MSTLDANISVAAESAKTQLSGYRGLTVLINVILGIVSILLSAALFAVIYKEKKFHTSGYLMLVNASILQLLVVVSSAIMAKLLVLIHRFYPLDQLVGRNALTRAIVLVIDFGYHGAMTALVVVGVQRCAAVYYYSQYRRLFTIPRTAVCILGTWVVGLALAVPCQVGPCQVYFDIAANTYMGNWGNPYTQAYSRAYLWYPMACIIFMIILYTAIGYRLRAMRRKLAVVPPAAAAAASSQQEMAGRRDEARLCVAFLIISLVYVVGVVQFYVYTNHLDWAARSQDEADALRLFETYLWFVNVSIDPYVHLLVNKPLRAAFARRLNIRTSTAHSSDAPQPAPGPG